MKKTEQIKRRVKSEFLFPIVAFSFFIYVTSSTYNLNPDLQHDAQFFVFASSEFQGQRLYKEVYTVYGPLASWLLQIPFILGVNDLIAVRIFGVIFQFLTACFMFLALNLVLRNVKVATLITLAFIVINPGLNEINSSRWPYGPSIWPTQILGLLYCVWIYAYLKLFYKIESKRARGTSFNIPLVMMGSSIALMFFTRLQGMISSLFLAMVTMSLFLILKQKHLLFRFLAYFFFFFLCCLTPLLSSDSLLEFMEQNILMPFRVASDFVEMSSWLRSVFLNVLISVSVVLLSIILAKSLLFRISRGSFLILATLAFVAFTGIYFYASLREYPIEFNDNLLLHFLSQVSHSGYWLGHASFVATLILSISRILKGVLKFGNPRELKLGSGTVSDFPIFVLLIAVSTNLFWNFSYTSLLFPVYAVILVLLVANQKMSQSVINGSLSFLTIFTATFSVVAIYGASLDRYEYKDASLSSFASTWDEARVLDKAVAEMRSFLASKRVYMSSCPIHYFRVLAASSWEGNAGDLGFNEVHDEAFDATPESDFDYILYCQLSNETRVSLKRQVKLSDNWKSIEISKETSNNFGVLLLEKRIP